MCNGVKFYLKFERCSRDCEYPCKQIITACDCPVACSNETMAPVKVRGELPGWCRWDDPGPEDEVFRKEHPLHIWKRHLRERGIIYWKLIQDLVACSVNGDSDDGVWSQLEDGKKYRVPKAIERWFCGIAWEDLPPFVQKRISIYL